MPLIVPGIVPPINAASQNFIPALIVVDMQTDFVTGSLAVPNAKSIIEPINAILSLPFALKVGTKDFHPPGHISFASTHNKHVGEKIMIYRPDLDPPDEESGIEQFLWPDHCVQSTPGSEFVEGFDSSSLHTTVYKGTHPGVECYSAFGDSWGLTTSELPTLLSAKEVTDVFVVGLAGDYCVKSTAIDSIKYSAGLETTLRTWVVKDLTKSVGDEAQAVDEMQKAGVRVIESDELKAMMEHKLL